MSEAIHTEGAYCPSCDGRGDFIDCFDALCHMNGECFDEGNRTCSLCGGDGRVSPDTREGYFGQRFNERARLTPLKTLVLLGAVALIFWATLALTNGVVSA
ncbi:uncharacterized protein Nmag_1608 [Natrialba magadii ATCC 43099]|uniref:Uncharacterized protein n=1 Tax=Natrialba magadii (strain ATCC 43099 / DSM 3394 / CCM 3739 / CIP 104546 / IAM 13178 / JCM 8861 / NBRC 102185 / NCIMB 2190 / MS3) TaxID=547559 RepID=D3SUC6_NATMM|nr:hypothetical protein [Natrialba magadii]ADD05184.1 uncharacterized protein Nmag_1608 [Natrialba magadii ATCC 43099]ELY23222.1 hypothetical protein C500_20571 [Natrialba magadii ATCC 43099]